MLQRSQRPGDCTHAKYVSGVCAGGVAAASAGRVRGRIGARVLVGVTSAAVMLTANLLSPAPPHRRAAPPLVIGLPVAAAECPPDCGGGDGSYGPPGGGQQFRPPAMGGQAPGYQGGVNSGIPGLNQNDGISIYNPTEQTPIGEVGTDSGYPQQAQARAPAHGQMPPNYDAPAQQPAQPAHQQPAQQQPAQQEPQQHPPTRQEPQQQPDNQDAQQAKQRQQQCQDAAAMLGNTLAGISGGGGRGPIWFEPGLDPVPTPTPPCPQCEPQTAQKQSPSNEDLQKQIDQLKEQNQDQSKQIDKLTEQNKDQQKEIDEAKKCDAGEWMTNITTGISSAGLLFVGIMSAPTGLGIAAAGFGAVGTAGALVGIARCISNG